MPTLPLPSPIIIIIIIIITTIITIITIISITIIILVLLVGRRKGSVRQQSLKIQVVG